MPDNENSEARPEQEAEAPQVYNVKKDVTGWKFGRREFLVAAAATTAAAIVATNKSEATPDPDKSEASESSIALAVTTLAVTSVIPGQPFVQVWRFTNNSRKTWARGARLHLENDEGLEAPTSVTVPDIAPGQTVDVQVAMVAPAELDTCQGMWHLQAANSTTPIASGSFVLQGACIIESDHPYLPNTNATKTVTNPDTNAQYTRVHFSQVELASYDYLYIRDGIGQEIQQITGIYSSGLWSNPVPGKDVQVQLFALDNNSYYNYYGYCLDQIETARVVYLPIIRKDPTPTPTPTPTPIPTPTPTPCGCHGYSCTCDTIHYWYPD